MRMHVQCKSLHLAELYSGSVDVNASNVTQGALKGTVDILGNE